MISTILFIITAIFYAKPVYWGVKAAYLRIKGIDEDSLYGEKLLNWLSLAKDLVKWQKEDL